jgi:chaperone required for assembly of F1-ATPase
MDKPQVVQRIRGPELMKRFYTNATVDEGEGGHRVLLDGKPVRTPAKSLLVVPTSGLAEAIAAEWRSIPEKADINISHLPLTRLAATGIDRVVSQRAQVVGDTAKYAGTDLLCYRATDPASLVRRQNETWQPLLDWAASHYGAELVVAGGTSFVEQPARSLERLREAVAAHGDLALAALYNVTHVAGSLVIALAVAERRISAADAFAAAELDELYQIERWGEDPIATQRHAGILRDFGAGSRFLSLLEHHRLIP